MYAWLHMHTLTQGLLDVGTFSNHRPEFFTDTQDLQEKQVPWIRYLRFIYVHTSIHTCIKIRHKMTRIRHVHMHIMHIYTIYAYTYTYTYTVMENISVIWDGPCFIAFAFNHEPDKLSCQTYTLE